MSLLTLLMLEWCYSWIVFWISCSESGLDCISIEWNLETFVDVLHCIYGCASDVTFDNFLPLIEVKYIDPDYWCYSSFDPESFLCCLLKDKLHFCVEFEDWTNLPSNVCWNLCCFENMGVRSQAALYFGVEMLLTRCKSWFSMVASSEAPPQIQLDELIYIWIFGLEHGGKLSEFWNQFYHSSWQFFFI